MQVRLGMSWVVFVIHVQENDGSLMLSSNVFVTVRICGQIHASIYQCLSRKYKSPDTVLLATLTITTPPKQFQSQEQKTQTLVPGVFQCISTFNLVRFSISLTMSITTSIITELLCRSAITKSLHADVFSVCTTAPTIRIRLSQVEVVIPVRLHRNVCDIAPSCEFQIPGLVRVGPLRHWIHHLVVCSLPRLLVAHPEIEYNLRDS